MIEDRRTSEAQRRLKIGIVVPGRFHSFDLARALLKRGHEAIIFTNYPGWVVERFGLPRSCVRSCWLHGVLQMVTGWLCARLSLRYPDRWLNPIFGRWASFQVAKEEWDLLHLWSGLAEEILKNESVHSGGIFLMRGSAHIEVQARLLSEEAKRAKARVAVPSTWARGREHREYELSRHIVVLSTFARDSFLSQDLSASKLRLLPLGVDVKAFRPTSEEVEQRCRRILSGQPLRLLYTGLISYRKGLLDMVEIVRRTGGRFEYRMVGMVTPEARTMARSLADLVEFVPHQPQSALPRFYKWADLYLFPTIEDGFATVLAQAQGSGLPILATSNCCGPDLVAENETGWLFPIRRPELFVERLLWCDAHREELSQMVRRIYSDFESRDWQDVAADFEAICFEHLDNAPTTSKTPHFQRPK